MSAYPSLEDDDLKEAILLWNAGYNTLEISHLLFDKRERKIRADPDDMHYGFVPEYIDISEAAVANSLANWRNEEYRKRRAA
jgi:hypothetical protein